MTDFIVVNGTPVDIRVALQWQALAGNMELSDRTVANAAVVQHARKNNLAAAPEEIQKFFDEMRHKMNFESAEATRAWMTQHNYDLATVQNFCEIGVLRNKIRASIGDGDVAAYFAENKQKYDIADLYSLTVAKEELANELKAQIEDGAATFQALAMEHSIDNDTYRQGGFMGETTRNKLSGAVEAAVFAAKPNEVLGPFKHADGYSLYMVRRIVSPQLEGIKELIRDEMFEQRLEDIADHAEVRHVLLGFNAAPGGMGG